MSFASILCQAGRAAQLCGRLRMASLSSPCRSHVDRLRTMTVVRTIRSLNGRWPYRSHALQNSDATSSQSNTDASSSQSDLQKVATATAPKPSSRNNKDDKNSSMYSTQAEILQNLGISNVALRQNHPNGASVNHRRKRQRFPARQASPQSGALYPLKALHIAQTIDLDKVMQTVLCEHTERRKLFGKNSLVVELESPESDPPRFVSVFRFGSVVFLNVPSQEAMVLTERIRNLSTNRVPPGKERREHFGIMVHPEGLYNPTLEPPPEKIVTGDFCIVPEIELNGVAVISNILGQTVALDSYNDTVDNLLSQFAEINSALRGNGHFKHSDKSFLFKTIAQNNSIFIDMISKIRLKDRSETAWTITKYETIHYGLKSEFEIDDRFDQIEFKLNLIQQNAKFFLEVMQHQKSNSLEWIIVVLIGAECVIMCVDMAGMGKPFFKFLGFI